MWQDIVISIVQWVMLLALFPTLLHREHKPALWSSIMTGSLLIILAYTFSTLDLWNATLSASAVGVGWFVLAWQRWKINSASAVEKNKNPVK